SADFVSPDVVAVRIQFEDERVGELAQAGQRVDARAGIEVDRAAEIARRVDTDDRPYHAHGQAGHVLAILAADPADPDEVAVVFQLDYEEVQKPATGQVCLADVECPVEVAGDVDVGPVGRDGDTGVLAVPAEGARPDQGSGWAVLCHEHV